MRNSGSSPETRSFLDGREGYRTVIPPRLAVIKEPSRQTIGAAPLPVTLS
jgi:hypothetical protein